MAQTFLLGAEKAYDTAKQTVEKNQIIQMNGYDDDKFVVYDIHQTKWGLSYELINLRTHEFGQCDLIRPLSEKFGIGYYFDDKKPQFMDVFEVIILRDEAERIADEKRKAKQEEQERRELLKAIGKERLQTLTPTKAVINDFALIAGEESNICVKAQTTVTDNTPDSVTGDFLIVDYSLKALAVFGDTRPIKDQLKELGGRFNPKLMHNEQKKAGWIFSKSKEQELRNLLTIK